MKPIDASLKKWLAQNENFQADYENLKADILNDPSIRQFLVKHNFLTDKDIERNLNTLHEYKSQSKHCLDCPSLSECKNILQGYYPVLQVADGRIHLAYAKCNQLIMKEQERRQSELIKSLYVPEDILQATYDDIDPDVEHRGQAISEIARFIDELEHGIPEKGIYFTGPFGVGKTFMLGALANKLKEYNRSTLIVYMPEFVQEIRSSIQDQSVNEKISVFKEVDVLMLDDIGAEPLSPWFRDEILGSILQYRMMRKLPVFFTSNYTMDQLEEQLAISNRGQVEQLKAGRIMERIRQVSNEAQMGGKNRRYE